MINAVEARKLAKHAQKSTETYEEHIRAAAQDGQTSVIIPWTLTHEEKTRLQEYGYGILEDYSAKQTKLSW